MDHTSSFPIDGRKVWVAGHRGMVGSALVRQLASRNCEVLTCDRTELDLRSQADVREWLDRNKPEAIFIAAGLVGGIHANKTRPAEFLYDNILIQANIIDSAYRSDVRKLMALGSSCVYPRDAAQPMAETALLQGPPEPTNEPYSLAKISGLKLCDAYRTQYGCDFISAVPANLYGLGDNFDLAQSHVIPAIMRKAHDAKLRDEDLELWGSGSPLREFLYVDDMADACIFLMESYSQAGHINIGFGEEISIRDLAGLICDVVQFKGKLRFDTTKPDGAPRKFLDDTRLRALQWRPRTNLREGLEMTYAWYQQQILDGRYASAAQ